MGAVRMLRPNHKGEDNKRIHPRARTWCPTCRHPSLNALDVGYPWRGTKFSDVFDVPFGIKDDQDLFSLFFIYRASAMPPRAWAMEHIGSAKLIKTLNLGRPTMVFANLPCPTLVGIGSRKGTRWAHGNLRCIYCISAEWRFVARCRFMQTVQPRPICHTL